MPRQGRAVLGTIMRVRAKLTLFLVLASVLPVVMTTVQAVDSYQKALGDTLLRLHASAATLGAKALEQRLSQVGGSLHATVQDTIDWDSLSQVEADAALWLIFGQHRGVSVATLTSRGRVIGRAYLETGGPAMPGHVTLVDADIEEFERVTPPPGQGLGLGAPMRTHAGAVMLPMVVTDASPSGSGDMAVAVGLDVASLCEAVGEARPSGGTIRLLDAWNREVCVNERTAALGAPERSLADVLAAKSDRYARRANDVEVQGAIASGGHGFKVVVEQPIALLGALARRLYKRAIVWLLASLVLAVGAGLLLARETIRPLEALSVAAGRIAAGEFGVAVPVGPRQDEFADLASSFNLMSRAVAERDGEINAWNAELQARVDERGRQLEDAHRVLLRSQRRAGLAVATAGIAHEMNNPLTGIVGLAQLLLARFKARDADERERGMLESILAESRRVEGLLKRMTSIDPEGADAEVLREVPIGRVIDTVLLSKRERIERVGALIQRDYQSERPALVDPYQMHSVFAELIENALTALAENPPGAARTVSVRVAEQDDDWLEVALRDTGRGISKEHLDRVFDPFFTTDAGACQGLGLTQVYQAVTRQKGAVSLESEPGQGTCVTLRFPFAGRGALLS